jgi:stalled ribosome rescue protein Dom34
MAHHYHAVLWIDHREARVIAFNAETAEEEVVRPAHAPRHLHAKAGGAAGTHVADDPEFYRDVCHALDDAKAVLVAGPSTAKTEFVKYLHRNAPETLDRISGIETLGRVSDRQLLEEGRRYFARADRMRPQQG